MLRDTSAARTRSRSTVSARVLPPHAIAAQQISAAAMILRVMRSPLRFAQRMPRQRPEGVTPGLRDVIQYADRRHRRACDAYRADSTDLRNHAARNQGDYARAGRVDGAPRYDAHRHCEWAAQRL